MNKKTYTRLYIAALYQSKSRNDLNLHDSIFDKHYSLSYNGMLQRNKEIANRALGINIDKS